MSNATLYIAQSARSTHAATKDGLAICGEQGTAMERSLHNELCPIELDPEAVKCGTCKLLVAEGNGSEDATQKLDALADHSGDNSNVAKLRTPLEQLAILVKAINDEEDGDDPEASQEALAEWVKYELGFEPMDERWELLFDSRSWKTIGICYTLGGVTVAMKIAEGN